MSALTGAESYVWMMSCADKATDAAIDAMRTAMRANIRFIFIMFCICSGSVQKHSKYKEKCPEFQESDFDYGIAEVLCKFAGYVLC